MKFTGKLQNIVKDWSTGQFHITFTMNEADAVEQIDKIKDCEKLSIEAKKYRQKRSLDANAYSWFLIDKLAKVHTSTSEEIYEEMLRKYGYPLYDEDGKPVIISLRHDIDVSKMGIHYKFIGEGHVGDKLFNHYKVIRGQSDYDTKEMSTFIDGIVSEAKESGIETLTPSEIERMKATWKA